MSDKTLLDKALLDARTARTLFSIDSEYYAEIISFHAQQAAEKMVKQALVDKGLFYQRTHHIDEVLDPLCAKLGIEPGTEIVEAADKLSLHAVNTRYTASFDVGIGEARQAIKYCDLIADFLANYGFDVVRIDEADNEIGDPPKPGGTGAEVPGEAGGAPDPDDRDDFATTFNQVKDLGREPDGPDGPGSR